MTGTINPTWSSLTCDGKLLQERSLSRSVKLGLKNPPVRSLPGKNPVIKTKTKTINLLVTPSQGCTVTAEAAEGLPLQQQVEPVPDDGHPDEPDGRVPAHVEPDGEQAEERGVQVGHRGRQAEQALAPTVLRLQADRQLDPPAVEEIHGFRRAGGFCSPARLRGCSVYLFSANPTGLYSRLAELFAFGTVQTSS